MKRFIQASVEKQWYRFPTWLLLLLPIHWLFCLISYSRRLFQKRRAYQCPLPIVVIGNINVGGTGKTPTIISLSRRIQNRGYRVAVISRGYGANRHDVRQVPVGAAPEEYGDEPVLIAREAQCAVVVGADRVATAQYVVKHDLADIILCDDGLQHYRLGRQLEVVLIDSVRKLGNGWRLPLGPLRESPKRLKTVDAILLNGSAFEADWLPSPKSYAIELKPTAWRHIESDKIYPLGHLNIDQAQAFAAIGNPQRFFSTLRQLGFGGTTHAFPDHHAFQQGDFSDVGERLLLMTEKDAVKVRAFAQKNWWSLVVEMDLPESFLNVIFEALPQQSS